MSLIKFLLETEGLLKEENEIVIDGFRLRQDNEYEEDNIKIWHTVTLPDGKKVTLDHTPYENLDTTDFKKYVAFFKKHNRFPERKDIKSNGPVERDDLDKLNESAIYTFNEQEPMNPEVLVKGVGRYSLKQLKRNVRNKLEDLYQGIEKSDSAEDWKKVGWKVKNAAMIEMIETINKAHEELEKKIN